MSEKLFLNHTNYTNNGIKQNSKYQNKVNKF